jgi:hypothetical protein
MITLYPFETRRFSGMWHVLALWFVFPLGNKDRGRSWPARYVLSLCKIHEAVPSWEADSRHCSGDNCHTPMSVALLQATAKCCTHPHNFFLRSTLILSSYLSLGCPIGLIDSGFQTKILYALLIFQMRVTCPTHLIILNLVRPNSKYTVQITKIIMQVPPVCVTCCHTTAAYRSLTLFVDSF